MEPREGESPVDSMLIFLVDVVRLFLFFSNGKNRRPQEQYIKINMSPLPILAVGRNRDA